MTRKTSWLIAVLAGSLMLVPGSAPPNCPSQAVEDDAFVEGNLFPPPTRPAPPSLEGCFARR